jgi:Domain of unknown function (DUF4249)
MMAKYITISLLIITLLVGCEEQFNWELDNKEADLIVVEAVLTNENKNHLIKLTKPYTVQNQLPKSINGAFVAILTNTDTVVATETPPNSGLYYTDQMQAVVSKVYILVIGYSGKFFYAFAGQPPGEPLEPLFKSEVSEGIYTLDFRKSGKNANYIKYSIDWQSVGNCPNTLDCQAKQIYYDLKNIDVNEQFKPTQERVDFPLGTVIVRRKYSVSPKYREYLRGMLSETSWRGGLFDSFPANAATNLSEGAVGFFAVSTVISDTTIITP